MAKSLPVHAGDTRDKGSIPDISWCVRVCYPGLGVHVCPSLPGPQACVHQLHTGVCLYLGAFEDQGTCKGDALEG